MDISQAVFSFEWSYETESLVIHCYTPDKTQHTKQEVSKELLQDISGFKLIDFFEAMANVLPSSSKPEPKLAEYMIAAHEKALDEYKKAKKVAMHAALYGSPAAKISDLGQLATPQTGLSYPQQALEQALMQQILALQQQQFVVHNASKPVVKELHVYDLGDGMLVPCEMAKELAVLFADKPKAATKKEMMGQWQAPPTVVLVGTKFSEDDLYKALYGKLNPIAPPKQGIQPGKSQYLTDNDAWFIDDTNKFFNSILDYTKKEKKIVDAISKKNAGKFGMIAQEQTPLATEVAIPKKPKQVTQQTLDYFQKLLGGKKDPYTDK